MATTYTQTDNLGLDLYGDNDPADLRDGYNSSMRKIDSAVKANADAVALKANSSDVHTKTEIDAALALKANSADVYTKAEVDSKIANVRLLVFGDSWTTYYDQYLPGRIATKLNAAWWKCYGMSGAKLDNIASQIATAGQDTSFDNSTVTHIVIVGGTNNIFDPGNGSDNGTLNQQLGQITSNLTKYYPRAICHYFPNNSRTSNGGRTKQYWGIIEYFRQYGAAVHPETIWILSYNNFESYRTDANNRENLQHLTQKGYEWLAGYITGCIRGGNATATTRSTETSCDIMYRNEFIDGTSGSGTPSAFVGDLKCSNMTNALKIEYNDGRAMCRVWTKGLTWESTTPPPSQRYALFDINTYPVNADLATWKYAQKKVNLATPRNTVFGNGAVYNEEYKSIFYATGTLQSDLFGSVHIRCFVDKGDTTSEWSTFNSISITFYPYFMF